MQGRVSARLLSADHADDADQEVFVLSSRYQALLFDMDGLLLDTEILWRAAWQRAAREFGYSITDRLYLQIVGLNPADTDRTLVAALGDDFPVAGVRALRTELWQQRVEKDGIECKPGIEPLLHYLEQQNIDRAIATSSNHWSAEICLQASGLAELFPVRATSDQVNRGKPHPDLYLRAAALLNIRPDQCLALEDSDNGATAALRAGMDVLIVPDLKPPTRGLVGSAVAVLNSLQQVPEWLKRQSVAGDRHSGG